MGADQGLGHRVLEPVVDITWNILQISAEVNTDGKGPSLGWRKGPQTAAGKAGEAHAPFLLLLWAWLKD